MEEKLRRLMKLEGINSTRLAEILGIQASGISHIMSGRNKPSFDFLLKLLQRFPQINPDWLLLDKGPMYRDEIKNKAAGSTQTQAQVQTQIQAGGIFDSGPEGGIGQAGGGDRAEWNGHRNNGQVKNDLRQQVSDFTVYNRDATGNTGTGASVPAGMERRQMTTGADNSAGTGYPQGTGRLFGPDDNDIIQRQPAHEINRRTPYNEGFVRSAQVERIVVFYKDKTFSEYQPE